MPTRRTTDDYFRIIKQNHKRYLDDNMITHLELSGGIGQAQLIEKYADKIKLYRSTKERYLNHAIQQISLASRIGHGALAALLGIGVGGLAYYAQKDSTLSEALNPLSGAKNIAAGAFSAVIGAGVSYLAYQAWLKSAKHPATDDFAQFQEAMKKAGFTDEKYAQLSADLVKLFHFRECVLLGLKDGSGTDMREEFKRKYSPDDEPFDDKALNIAIEAYFLDQLNHLFDRAFRDIYAMQDHEILAEEAQNPIITWLKSFFENPEERQKFTQQLQIQFMEQCLNYLEAEMAEPSFMAKHPYATTSVIGLAAGLGVLTVAAMVLGGPVTIGIVAMALIATAVSAAVSYWAVHNVEALQYKRSKENRDAIRQTVDHVTMECTRLERLIKQVVETTPEDIKQLEKYRENPERRSFLEHFTTLFDAHEEVAMGAGKAWIREHASRYRHSKAIEIDLSTEHRQLIEKGEAQTAVMQGHLKTMMGAERAMAMPEPLQRYMNDTKAYLSKPEHHEFIKKFELVEKIRQQVLDIVAAVPLNTPQKQLPQTLIDFYTFPIEKGGLGGMSYDLEQVRALAPVLPEHITAVNQDHPYYPLLVTAQQVNFALSRNKNRAFIFIGDADYREMLGLRVDAPSERIEKKLHAGNIRQYLQASFDFLYSLNQRDSSDASDSLDKPFENSKEFTLYRMLLIKQLACLADPNNLRIDESIRREIYKFAQERLQIDPAVVFDDVLNQSLFIQRETDGPSIQDPLMFDRSIAGLEHVAEAIRVDMAYASKPLTPRLLIAMEANDFLTQKRDAEKTIFCHGHSKTILIPEASEAYVETVRNTIVATRAFIAEMASRDVLKKSGALDSYLRDSIQEVFALRQAIVSLDQMIGGEDTRKLNSPELRASADLLKQYQEELELRLVEPAVSAEATPLKRDHSFLFNFFRKSPSHTEPRGSHTDALNADGMKLQ
ncbi:sulfite exporter TauE/SafE family protein [Legionella nagasakiensis]|uniref:sulfite exporter TauE/SafE family protein n=1 Tax=Legionella nagasakiensis TaxID=535290 RepID=UPI00105501E5|nr:sulfite exporter TauE/SafE family protein [Legionella nagasakiensis]